VFESLGSVAALDDGREVEDREGDHGALAFASA
jgi:hypothetical protein